MLFAFWKLFNFTIKTIYPLKYENIVSENAEKYRVEKPLIYAIIKSESNFNEDAYSHAGALGLMQITPDTFNWLELYTHKHCGKREMKSPAVNVAYGALFMSILLKKYGNLDTSLCAYNAGIATVDGWLKNKEISPDGKTLKTIPYKETADYVKKVKLAYAIYKKIYFNKRRN